MPERAEEVAVRDEFYDHDVPLSMRADCVCGHPAADHPVDVGGPEAISFACLRSGCDCRNWRHGG